MKSSKSKQEVKAKKTISNRIAEKQLADYTKFIEKAKLFIKENVTILNTMYEGDLDKCLKQVNVFEKLTDVKTSTTQGHITLRYVASNLLEPEIKQLAYMVFLNSALIINRYTDNTYKFPKEDLDYLNKELKEYDDKKARSSSLTLLTDKFNSITNTGKSIISDEPVFIADIRDQSFIYSKNTGWKQCSEESLKSICSELYWTPTKEFTYIFGDEIEETIKEQLIWLTELKAILPDTLEESVLISELTLFEAMGLSLDEELKAISFITGAKQVKLDPKLQKEAALLEELSDVSKRTISLLQTTTYRSDHYVQTAVSKILQDFQWLYNFIYKIETQKDGGMLDRIQPVENLTVTRLKEEIEFLRKALENAKKTK